MIQLLQKISKLRQSLTKDAQTNPTENYTLLKKNLYNLNKWRNVPCLL